MSSLATHAFIVVVDHCAADTKSCGLNDAGGPNGLVFAYGVD